MDRSDETQPVEAVLCIDRPVYSRLWEVIRHLCVGLVDSNARLRLLSSCREVESLTLGPIRTMLHAEPNWPFHRQRLRQIVDALSDQKPTVVHALSGGTYPFGQALARAFDVDLVVHVTAVDDVRALPRLGGRGVQHVVAASGPLRDLVCRDRTTAAEAVSLIRPGMLRSDSPTCFARAGNVPTLQCTAELAPGSGAEQLLHAVRILVDRGYEFLAFFAGGGGAESELRKLVRRQKISPAVTFARPREDTGNVLSGADIWVCPAPELAITSRSLQAMATGTAVVTCAGGVTDHCIDGHTAVVCPHGEPKALADGIERLLADREYALALAVAGMAHMKEHHAVSTMAEQVMNLYQQLRFRRRTVAMKA